MGLTDIASANRLIHMPDLNDTEVSILNTVLTEIRPVRTARRYRIYHRSAASTHFRAHGAKCHLAKGARAATAHSRDVGSRRAARRDAGTGGCLGTMVDHCLHSSIIMDEVADEPLGNWSAYAAYCPSIPTLRSMRLRHVSCFF